MSIEDRRFTFTAGKKQISESFINCVNDGEYTPEEVVEFATKMVLYLSRNYPQHVSPVFMYTKRKFEKILNMERFKSWRLDR